MLRSEPMNGLINCEEHLMYCEQCIDVTKAGP